PCLGLGAKGGKFGNVLAFDLQSHETSNASQRRIGGIGDEWPDLRPRGSPIGVPSPALRVQDPYLRTVHVSRRNDGGGEGRARLGRVVLGGRALDFAPRPVGRWLLALSGAGGRVRFRRQPECGGIKADLDLGDIVLEAAAGLGVLLRGASRFR